MRKVCILLVLPSLRIGPAVNTSITWLLNNRREFLSAKHALRSQYGLFSLY